MDSKKRALSKLLLLLLVCGVFVFYKQKDKSSLSPITPSISIYNPDLTNPGINVFHNLQRKVTAISNRGDIVHRWKIPIKNKQRLHHIRVGNNGELYGAFQNESLFKIDYESNLLWKLKLKAHHDIDFLSNGDLATLYQYEDVASYKKESFPVRADGIAIVSKDGKLKESFSLYKIVKSLIPRDAFGRAFKKKKDGKKKPPDLLHSNSLFILKNDHPIIGQKGFALISLRNINTLVSINLEQKALAWSLKLEGSELPHEPIISKKGTILIFDNGRIRKYSRVLEIDPANGKILWEYLPENKLDFFSYSQGGLQELPNGNLLVTEGNNGRVIEITRDKKIVWQYINSDSQVVARSEKSIKKSVKKKKKMLAGRKAAIGFDLYRMHRITSL